ncbi:MAG: bifunctional adenosylcobinamide kinase/adenosylcobinamide-phosphate guanylyltransferase [Lachnospiraceae bacterium]|nr:bifunctional adenosylcobinamide kinase/adenosylcobinamide-phosphate guanylyltransferase [Lachnospiraceae bacterium]
MMILVVGSPDSGKSVKAEELAVELSGNEKKIYLATMIPFGEEGAARVEKHRALRNGKGFVTVERPLNVGSLPDSEGFIEGIRAEEATVLLECAANLCANVMFAVGRGVDAKSPEETAEIVTEYILRL